MKNYTVYKNTQDIPKLILDEIEIFYNDLYKDYDPKSLKDVELVDIVYFIYMKINFDYRDLNRIAKYVIKNKTKQNNFNYNINEITCLVGNYVIQFYIKSFYTSCVAHIKVYNTTASEYKQNLINKENEKILKRYNYWKNTLMVNNCKTIEDVLQVLKHF